MGEYARYRGQSVKIGTCEDMYYLRADQAHLVQPEAHSLDPRQPDMQAVIRFRFPWPDEDGVQPGAFDSHDRGVAVPGDVPLPVDLEHHSVQFVAQRGYNICLPCPEAPDSARVLGLIGCTVHRNGFGGRVRIVQQAYRRGQLALVCECGGCGARFNLPWEQAEPIVAACEAEAQRKGAPMSSAWWHAVADRIVAGYYAQEITEACHG